ncbi:hypothetical protein [Neisseria bacilliformis]|uniref:hypothetical protein n=1 Tax=Neisseria bacilliformis TaxID=267212 RepID=UPI0028E990AB|nr:hypothetical protein [Neisseria bacilliformis]
MQQFPIRLPAKRLAVGGIGGFNINLAVAVDFTLLLVSVLCIAQAAAFTAAPQPPNSFGSLLLLAAVGIGLTAYFCLVRIPQTLRLSRNVRAILQALNRPEAQPWKLVAIPFYVSRHTRSQTFYAYNAEIGGQTQEIEFSGDSFEPVRYHGNCLAFAPRHGGAAVPIDTALRTIRGLTRAERREMIRQIEELVEVQIL